MELPNGRLLGAIRVHTVPVTMYTTFSDDKGKTWSQPMATGVDGYPPHLMVHSSGAVICSYCRRGGPGNQSERALVSYDNGETWADDYEIHGDVPFCDFGYPASVELADGSILTVYYQCWPGDRPGALLCIRNGNLRNDDAPRHDPGLHGVGCGNGELTVLSQTI